MRVKLVQPEDAFIAVAELLPWVAPVVGGVLGAITGSFIICVRYRLPRGESLRQPPSCCPACKRTLTVFELVPVFSWLALRGCCYGCGARIGKESLVIELVSLVVGALLGVWIGLNLWTLPLLCAGLTLYAAAAVVLWPRA